jgi:hypothetical protein
LGELPATITNFLGQVYALFPKPVEALPEADAEAPAGPAQPGAADDPA